METIRVIKIDPSQAEMMLRRNNINRPLNEKTISNYCKQMVDGHWIFNGDAIRFDCNQRLIDGQHRLHALIRSKTTQKFLVIDNISPEAIDTIDTGKIRSAGDVLRLHGFERARDAAALIIKILNYQKGSFYNLAGHREIGIPNHLVYSYMKQHYDEIMESISIERTHETKILYTGTLHFLHWLFRTCNKESASTFIDYLNTGLGLHETHPIYIVRERLIKDFISHTKLPLKTKIAMVIKAWNYWRNGRIVRSIVWTEKEEFPKPI